MNSVYKLPRASRTQEFVGVLSKTRFFVNFLQKPGSLRKRPVSLEQNSYTVPYPYLTHMGFAEPGSFKTSILFTGTFLRLRLYRYALQICCSSVEAVRIPEVESVIEKLNLKKCADTVVGSPGLVRGISGGERKRTNVALSLLGRPSLLLLDEPTSGLDSKMSDSLMKDVKQITQQGCTVVATIHQPSEAVFCRFDKVLLLETGRVAYYGVISNLRTSLSDLGFSCPHGTPLPELLLDVLEPPAEPAASAVHREKLAKFRQLSDGLGVVPTSESAVHNSSPSDSRAGLCLQLLVLFRRELVNVKRNKALTVVRAVQSIASSLLIGFIFFQLEHNISGIQTRQFSSFLLVFAQFLFALLGVVNAFPAERAVFLRETQDKLYHPAAFYLAKVSVDTIMQCFFPILVVAISYPLIGLNGERADRVLWFYAIMAVCSNCGAGVGFMVSAAVPSVSLALSIAPGLVMPQLLLSGIFIKVGIRSLQPKLA